MKPEGSERIQTWGSERVRVLVQATIQNVEDHPPGAICAVLGMMPSYRSTANSSTIRPVPFFASMTIVLYVVAGVVAVRSLNILCRMPRAAHNHPIEDYLVWTTHLAGAAGAILMTRSQRDEKTFQEPLIGPHPHIHSSQDCSLSN